MVAERAKRRNGDKTASDRVGLGKQWQETEQGTVPPPPHSPGVSWDGTEAVLRERGFWGPALGKEEKAGRESQKICWASRKGSLLCQLLSTTVKI